MYYHVPKKTVYFRDLPFVSIRFASSNKSDEVHTLVKRLHYKMVMAEISCHHGVRERKKVHRVRERKEVQSVLRNMTECPSSLCSSRRYAEGSVCTAELRAL